MKKNLLKIGLLILMTSIIYSNVPIYITFLWHMHQPIYWPYQTVVETDNSGVYSFSLSEVHYTRAGCYTTWPTDAINTLAGSSSQHGGAQMSFSGSLMENLNSFEANGGFSGWASSVYGSRNTKTSLGNYRLDVVGFGYYHPLMALITGASIRRQIQLHKKAVLDNFGGSYSKGIFPPENAFAPWMIPSLVAEGLEWVFVDNIHFDRTCEDYPYNKGSNLYAPNKADILNPNPKDWVHLDGCWAPTDVSGLWGHQPHYVKWIDGETGEESKIIAVPTDRYMGNEDGRGGYGALNYEAVIGLLAPYNTDPSHPALVVLHHDGDNYGGGTDSYYHSNFSNYVNWVTSNSGFEAVTVDDYLEMFPPPTDDIIHVEPGSWSGADNGDPEFLKWNGDPSGDDDYSPDRNSWGVLIAARNYVMTAEDIQPGNIDDIYNKSGNNTSKAWEYFLVSQTSCYWYWDGTEMWDAHVTRACNEAVSYAQSVVSGQSDNVGPSMYLPQRQPYNPGGYEWGETPESSDVQIWSYVYDISGLQNVTLKYRIDNDGKNSLSTNHNELYSGGSDVGSWISIQMSSRTIPSRVSPAPIVKADEYYATITGLDEVLIDYYIEATDNNGNINKSIIQHVYIGSATGDGLGGEVSKNATVTLIHSKSGNLHWGVNDWTVPAQIYWPAGSEAWSDGKSIETPLLGPDDAGNYYVEIGPFNDPDNVINKVNYIFHCDNGSWEGESSFTIDNTDTSTNTLPEVQLLDPNDSQIWSQTENIRWNASDADNDNLTISLYYTDNGVNWYLLSNNEINDGSYLFNTELFDNGTTYKIKVRAADGDGYTEDSSDSYFTISNNSSSGIPQDINNDNVVDGLDLIQLAISFGTSSGDSGFDPRCDFNDDNVIDGLDLIALATKFGSSWG